MTKALFAIASLAAAACDGSAASVQSAIGFALIVVPILRVLSVRDDDGPPPDPPPEL